MLRWRTKSLSSEVKNQTLPASSSCWLVIGREVTLPSGFNVVNMPNFTSLIFSRRSFSWSLAAWFMFYP